MTTRVVPEDRPSGSFSGANTEGRMPTKYVVTRKAIAEAAGVSLDALYKAERRGALRVHLPDSREVDLVSVAEYVIRSRQLKSQRAERLQRELAGE